jgi:hypothetical protein
LPQSAKPALVPRAEGMRSMTVAHRIAGACDGARPARSLSNDETLMAELMEKMKSGQRAMSLRQAHISAQPISIATVSSA